MTQRDEWEICRSFCDRGAAEVLRARLAAEGVPAHVEVGTLEGAVEGFDVIVPSALAHRARWILAQALPSDEELDYLATGKLRGEE